MNRGLALPPHRPLAILAALTGVLAVVLLPAMVLDDRQLLGVSVWLKPWKFAVSIAIYSLTVAWMVTLVRKGARLARGAATVAAVALGIEIALITAQAARGVPSHFNTQTPLDSTLFNVMGASIVSAWVATGVLALVLVRQRLDDRVLAVGLGWGLGVGLLGMILAVLMINPLNQFVLQQISHAPPTLLDGGHTVGAPDGGPGLPITNWSTRAGDLRAPHFVGIHALQLLPLLAWLLGRRARRLRGGQQVGLVHVAGGVYLGVVVLLVWQALRGEPVTRPGATTLAAAGVLLLAGVAAAASPWARDAGVHPPCASAWTRCTGADGGDASHGSPHQGGAGHCCVGRNSARAVTLLACEPALALLPSRYLPLPASASRPR
jgi:hypothetical protein